MLPQPSLCVPQLAVHSRGTHTPHTLAVPAPPQVSPMTPHEPHSTVPPQPSAIWPQLAPRSAQLCGAQHSFS
jgi:hypothetical protein